MKFGRYQGVQGKIGFDGLWKSPKDYHIVVETKTAEVYSHPIAPLLNYINELVSAGEIPSPDDVLGLYVVGRLDPEVRQLENAIVAQKRTHELRLISAEALLSLAEAMHEYDARTKKPLTFCAPCGQWLIPS